MLFAWRINGWVLNCFSTLWLLPFTICNHVSRTSDAPATLCVGVCQRARIHAYTHVYDYTCMHMCINLTVSCSGLRLPAHLCRWLRCSQRESARWKPHAEYHTCRSIQAYAGKHGYKRPHSSTNNRELLEIHACSLSCIHWCHGAPALLPWF